MKPSTAKAKGAQTESMFVEFLQSNGVPNAERRHLQGVLDEGDIAGWVKGDGSRKVAVEVKSGGSINLPQWIRELEAEVANSKSETGFIAIRPKGKPNPEEWWAVMPMQSFMELMKEAGYVPTF